MNFKRNKKKIEDVKDEDKKKKIVSIFSLFGVAVQSDSKVLQVMGQRNCEWEGFELFSDQLWPVSLYIKRRF